MLHKPRPRASFLLSGAAAGACAAVIAACGSPSLAKARADQAPSRPVPTAPIPTATKDRGYQAARKQWIAEGNVIGGADQDVPLERAVTDLEHGEVTDSGNKSEYWAVIAVIKDFEHMPDAMVTAAQEAAGRADAAKIDKFFHFTAIKGCAWPSVSPVCWAIPSPPA